MRVGVPTRSRLARSLGPTHRVEPCAKMRCGTRREAFPTMLGFGWSGQVIAISPRDLQTKIGVWQSPWPNRYVLPLPSPKGQQRPCRLAASP